MISARRRRFLLRLPTPRELVFVKQSQDARRPCPKCGKLDRAVTTQRWVTYYGPAVCPCCGHVRGLRPRERTIDREWLRAACGLRSAEAYRSAWRERLEVDPQP
jgi:hypothetical protein